MKRMSLLLLLWSGSLLAEAQLPSGLTFLSGRWHTSHEWGNMTESWAPPEGDVMSGSFQCTDKGKPVFYELMVVERLSEDSVVLYLRHFGPRSQAWEAPDSAIAYLLQRHGPKDALFTSFAGDTQLMYQLLKTDQLKCTLREREASGIWKETVFIFDRKAL